MSKSLPFQTTIGHDCEFQLRRTKDNQIVSAIPVLKNTKENKIDLGDGFYCFADNVNFEVNVPPAETKEEFLQHRLTLIDKVKTYLKGEYELAVKASHHFTKEECSHPEAIRAGCSPEFDARLLEMAYPPELGETTLRSCAGHFHTGRKGYKKCAETDFLIDPMSKVDVVLMSDLYAALPSVMLDNTPEGKERKKLYGRNSRHRPTPFGVELRQMSNFWFASADLADLMYDLVIESIHAAYEKRDIKVDESAVVKAIDENDAELAHKLIKTFMDKKLLARVEKLANR